MFKSATTYRAVLGISLAFFFGLTLGLTLNLVGSQTSTANRTRAAGGNTIFYCRMLLSDFTTSSGDLKVCNELIGGYMGYDLIDGILSDNTQIGTSVNLQFPKNPATNPKNTTCSVVQYDGAPGSNQVYVRYSADARNYCQLHPANMSSQDHCMFFNVAENDPERRPYNQESLDRLKGEFAQKCVTPTSTPVPPTGALNTVCTPPNQNYISNSNNNLSYNLNATNIPANSNAELVYQFCLNPQSNQGHRSVYQYYFNSGANWEDAKNTEGLPSWACYKIGSTAYTNSTSLSRTWNETIPLYGNTTATPKNLETLASFIRTAAEVGSMNINTTFRTKVVVTVNGIKNDQISAPQLIKIHPTACYIAPTSTPKPPTSTPAPTNTPPAQACTYTTPVTLGRGDWLGDSDGHRGQTQSYSMPGLDYSKPVKIAVDWGWAGNPKNDPVTLPPDLKNPQRGPVDLPGIDNDKAKERSHQVNEKSDVKIQYFAKTNLTSPQLHGTINCPDVGEWKFSGNLNTPFSDGRVVRFNNTLTTNLKDVDGGNGDWYTCYMWNGNGAQIQPVKAQQRPATAWYEVRLNANTHANKLQFDKVFTGGPSTRAAEAVADRGSHYTRVKVSYCKLP